MQWRQRSPLLRRSAIMTRVRPHVPRGRAAPQKVPTDCPQTPTVIQNVISGFSAVGSHGYDYSHLDNHTRKHTSVDHSAPNRRLITITQTPAHLHVQDYQRQTKSCIIVGGSQYVHELTIILARPSKYPVGLTRDGPTIGTRCHTTVRVSGVPRRITIRKISRSETTQDCCTTIIQCGW